MIEFADRCPRCGSIIHFNVECMIDDDCIHTEAFGMWNESTHTFNPPYTNADGDIACPVCQAPLYVSGKIDLALVSQSIYVPRTLNTWLEEETERNRHEPRYEAYFHFDDPTLAFFGYMSRKLWNGWKCPAFPKASADAIMNYYNSLDEGLKAWYDEETDTYLFWDVVNDEEPLAFSGTRGFVDGVETVLYDIGSWNWTWESTSAIYDQCKRHAIYYDDDREPDREVIAIAKWSKTEGPGSEEYLKDDKHPDLEMDLFCAELMVDVISSATGRLILDKSIIEEVERGEEHGEK